MARKKIEECTKEELIQEIKKLTRRKNKATMNKKNRSKTRRSRKDRIINDLGKLLLRFNSSIKKSQVLSIFLLIFTIGILFLGVWQFSIIKGYQDWSRKEMSRKPDLSLVINKIDTLDTSNSLRFYCNLKNTGNEIAQNVQIRHRLFPPSKSTDFTFEVTGPIGIIPFSDQGVPYVKIAVYIYSKTIYYEEDENKDYELKLPYTWELQNLPHTREDIVLEYTIHSHRGSFKKSLTINNPFYKVIKKKNKVTSLVTTDSPCYF